MWDNAPMLRQIADTLFIASLLLVLYGVVHYVVHLPQFPLRSVALHAAPQRVDTAQVEALVRSEVHGNFFTVDVEGLRSAFEKLPWVRKVNIRRHFPWSLEVELEEHVALARWNGTGLVNTHGEVFTVEREIPEESDTPRPPLYGEKLPNFYGQADNAAEVTQMYGALSTTLAPLRKQIEQIVLTPRRAWQLRLHDGMVLELGREQAQERLARFVAVYSYSLAPLRQTGSGRVTSRVDLRYQNGFAVYLPGSAVSDGRYQG